MLHKAFHRCPRHAIVLAALLGGLSLFARAAGAGSIQVISRADPIDPLTWSVTANGDSFISDVPQSIAFVRTSMSSDSRFIAFSSTATNLIPGLNDQNQTRDIFLYDRRDRSTILVSRKVGDPSTTANGTSSDAVISGDGRFVTFTSDAMDLTTRTDTLQTVNVYLYDRTTGTVNLVSRSLSSPTTAGNDFSSGPAVSDDGRYIAFFSFATNLVPEQIVNAVEFPVNMFLFDRIAGTTALVSRAASGATSGNHTSGYTFTMSGDGRYIAYISSATDLVPGGIANDFGAVFLYDSKTGINTLVSHSAASVSYGSNGEATNPVISHDGRYVAYESFATDLVPGQVDTNGASDVFLYGREEGRNTLVSRSSLSPVTTGDCLSFLPYPDGHGKHIAFTSCATDLVTGVSDGNGTLDAFLFDLETGKTELVSHSATDLTSTGNTFSDQAVISRNGRYVAYRSTATDLIPGQIDIPYSFDVFLYDRESRLTTLVSHALGAPQQAGTGSDSPGLSPSGQYLVFLSSSSYLVEGDANGSVDIFLVHHPGGEGDD